MLKYGFTLLCLFLLHVPNVAVAQDTASDFFDNLSYEKDILDALYNRSRSKQPDDVPFKPFTLAGEGGLLRTSGNSNTQIVKVAIESNHEMTNWSNRYEAQLLSQTNTLTSDDGDEKVETSRVEVSGQFDYKLVKPNNRLFAYLEYDDNQFNSLRDQATVVLGWSQVAWKKETSELRYSIGPGYSHFRQVRDGLRIEEMIIRGTVFYNLNFGENSRFRQTFSAESGDDIKKARAQSSVTAKVFEKLAMKFSVDIVFNESVAAVDSDLSTQTSVSMVYQFF